MNRMRVALEQVFGSPIQNMTFVHYMAYVNENGKVTAKSMLDMITVLLTYIDAMEARNEQYEANFKEIEQILKKLVDKPASTPAVPTTHEMPVPEFVPKKIYTCDQCGKEFYHHLGLAGHKQTHLPKK